MQQQIAYLGVSGSVSSLLCDVCRCVCVWYVCMCVCGWVCVWDMQFNKLLTWVYLAQCPASCVHVCVCGCGCVHVCVCVCVCVGVYNVH